MTQLSCAADHLQKMSHTKCPGSETAVKMGLPLLLARKPWKITSGKRFLHGREWGGFCLRRQICIDCGQPLLHTQPLDWYVAAAVRSSSYSALYVQRKIRKVYQREQTHDGNETIGKQLNAVHTLNLAIGMK